MGDRFYGSPDLIAWCRKQGWDWRLRLKQDLLVLEDGGESTLAERLRLLRNQGSRRKYHHDIIGPNSRLDSNQAAVLRVKLPHLAGWSPARRDHAKRYDAVLRGIDGVRLTEYDPNAASACPSTPNCPRTPPPAPQRCCARRFRVQTGRSRGSTRPPRR